MTVLRTGAEAGINGKGGKHPCQTPALWSEYEQQNEGAIWMCDAVLNNGGLSIGGRLCHRLWVVRRGEWLSENEMTREDQREARRLRKEHRKTVV